MVYYSDGDTQVQLGDQVELRGGIVLLFKKLVGRVVYVPGISPLSGEMEFNGLEWVAIQIPGKALVKRLVDPDTRQLAHKTRLLQRGPFVAAQASTALVDAPSDN